MSKSILIRGGTVVNADISERADVLIKDGKDPAVKGLTTAGEAAKKAGIAVGFTALLGLLVGAVVTSLLLANPNLPAPRRPEGPVVPVTMRLAPTAYFLVNGLNTADFSAVVVGLLDLPE